MDNIIKCNVFQVSDIELEMCNTQEQTTKLLNSSQLYNERLKSSYAYNSLVQDSTIIWYSDNIYDEKANKLSIEKIDDEIIYLKGANVRLYADSALKDLVKITNAKILKDINLDLFNYYVRYCKIVSDRKKLLFKFI